jgi:hypothetical protein
MELREGFRKYEVACDLVGWRRLPFAALLHGSQGVAGQPREVVGWPAHVAKAPPSFPKVVVVDVKERVVEEKREKEGGVGRPATHFGRLAKLWPPFL